MEEIMAFVENLDPAQLLPDLGKVFSDLRTWTGIAVKAGPVFLLAVGLVYLLRPPKEANHILGFRTPFGMGSVPAWKFTQRIAGITWTALGAVLLIIALVKDGSLRELEPMDSAVSALWLLFGQAVTVGIGWLALNIVPTVLFHWNGQPRFHMPEKAAKAESTEKPPLAKKIGMKLWRRSEGPTRSTEEKPGQMENLGEDPEVVPAEPEQLPEEPELSGEPVQPETAEDAPEAVPERSDEDEIFESIQRNVNQEEL